MTGKQPRKPRRGSDFSRIRAVDVTDDRPTVQDVPPDLEGKRALFSATSAPAVEPTPAAFGSVVIDCGRCQTTTVLTPSAALQHVVPSLHLPYLKPKRGSWMRCPSCRHRTWVSVQIRL